MPRPTFQISVDARLIFERLSKTSVGDVVNYEELGQLIGRDVQSNARGALYSARRKAFNDSGMVFACVIKIGVKRLSDVEIVDSVAQDLRRAHRASRRAARRLAAVKFDQLPKEKQTRHNAYMSMLGALNSVTSTSSAVRIEKLVAESRQVLPLARTLEAFK